MNSLLLAADGQLPLPWDLFGWGYLIDMYSNIDSLFDGIKDILPILLPILVGFIAIRKAISFLLGTLRHS